MTEESPNTLQKKIVTQKELKQLLSRWRLKSRQIVFTNGCFDILHVGHVMYLNKAKQLGHKLIIGLNSDASVKRLKGSSRPINDETSRAIVLAALLSVDAIVIFDEDTPFELIKSIQPDVLVKGGDYNPDETDASSAKYIVGSDVVRKNGGKVVTIDFVDGFSTTNIIQKSKNGES